MKEKTKDFAAGFFICLAVFGAVAAVLLAVFMI